MVVVLLVALLIIDDDDEDTRKLALALISLFVLFLLLLRMEGWFFLEEGIFQCKKFLNLFHTLYQFIQRVVRAHTIKE